jgi:hypothetical protein
VKGLKFPPAVESVVMKGLERDPTRRWKTVNEFARAFCEAVETECKDKKPGFFSSFFKRGDE